MTPEKFFLLAPASLTDMNLENFHLIPEDKLEEETSTLSSRNRYKTNHLKYRVFNYNENTCTINSTMPLRYAGNTISLTKIRLFEGEKHAFISMRAEVDLDVCHMDLSKLEELLTETVSVFLTTFNVCNTPILWVNRTHIIQTREIPEWIPDNKIQVQLSKVENHETQKAVTCDLAWGNNQLHFYENPDPQTTDEIVLGMLDAQTIWGELQASMTSLDSIAETLCDSSHYTRATHKAMRRKLDAVEVNLTYLEQLLMESGYTIQGNRRSIATHTLKSWDIDSAKEQSDKLLSRLNAVHERRIETMNNRHNNAVQLLLFVLALLGIVDSASGLFSLLFSTPEHYSYSGNQIIDVMHILKWIGPNNGISVALLSVIILFIIINQTRHHK